jgi:hypothetical protein
VLHTVLVFGVIGAIATVNLARAQVSHGGLPYSFIHDVGGQPPVESMPAIDEDVLRAEDRADQGRGRPVPPRFGTAIDVRLGLGNAGRWTELPGGARLWRLRITSNEAHSLNFIFDRYDLPPGGRLFIYNQVHNPSTDSTVLGAFTEANNKSYGRFSTLPIEGAVITLEYYEPAEHRGETDLRVSKVIHGYRNIFAHGSNGFGASADCEKNVNCSEGSGWSDEKRAVAMILVDQNTRACTGALVNNEPLWLTPYFLTAYHCYTGDNTSGGVSDWVFWFNYESSSCSDPSDEPGHDGISGASYKAGLSDSDFLLLELSEIPPYKYNTYYAGWSAVNTPAQSSVGIHHPHGDIKKISIENDPATSSDFNYNPPSDSHWGVYFDVGTVEHGSSGSPLFDQNSRIVGQLTGNDDSSFNRTNYCEVPHGDYGKFSMSWDRGSSSSTRLSDWLDPNDTGTKKLDGIEGPSPLDVSISGPTQVSEGESETWTSSVSGGDGSYDSYIWEKKIGENSSRWKHACIGSSSCTTSFEDSDSEHDGAYLRLQVKDQGGRYYGKTTYSVDVLEEGGYYSTRGQEPEKRLPKEFSLQGTMPNPADEQTTIRFALPEGVNVELIVYDMIGRVVRRLIDRTMEPGYKVETLRTSSLPSGAYVYRLRAGNFLESKTFTVLH